jgi:LytR cell envelope-related transcriptional attenuator
VAPWLVALAALGVAVAALLILTGGNGQSVASGNSGSHTGSGAHGGRHHSVAFKPADVTVAVLNGTQVYNLAHDTGQRLKGYGYKEGNITTAANQTQTATIVAYLHGHREDAIHVARTLGLHRSAVAPVDSTTLQVACPPPGRCRADVFVTIGQDLANAQTTTT